MSLATLGGYALKTLAGTADHTYATSSNGHVWPCWGRSAGGRALQSGSGNSDAADCLSQPNSEAGIVYSVTGVCHQTTNRILSPSGATVSAASGYRFSFFVYGTYGFDLGSLQSHSPQHFPWPELADCQSNHTHP